MLTPQILIKMKIYNLSYNDKERFREVYAITGQPYGLFSSIRMGGTGSPPLTIIDGPAEVMKIINQTYDRNYCNIEILRNGIIFRFKSRLENYGVPIGLTDLKGIRFFDQNEKIPVGESLLEIEFEDGLRFHFRVKPHEKAGLVKFFGKKIFENKLPGV
jgi:hypothetical protein